MFARLIKDENGKLRAYVSTIAVEDIDAYTGKIVALGGRLVVPKMPIENVGWIAYFKDPAGELFGVLEEDPGVW